MTTLILNLVGLLAYYIYPLIIGYSLQDFLPKKVELNNTFFLINTFAWIGGYLAISIISDEHGMSFSGLAALPFFYLMFAFLYSQAFPAKTLKSLEMKTEASLGDYFGDFMLILFLPIGIWFLQPRINRVIEKEKVAA